MLKVEYYKELPTEYEPFLVERYDSFLTNCRYIEIYTPNYDLNFMCVYQDDKLIDLLIFGNQGDTSTCLNSLVDIDQEIVSACSNKIFEIYPFIKKIVIAASYKNYLLKKSFLFDTTNDFIIRLPHTMDEYFKKLGTKTRQHLKNYKSRLLREIPSVKFVTKYKDEIEEGMIHKIIEMNISRMIQKGIVPAKEIEEKNNFYRYSLHYGCVAYIEIDGEIVAGCISTILNKRIFLQVISHDSRYSKYNVGQLCAVYLIQTAIEKGLLSFHFLWGENDYKKRLSAIPHIMFSYCIYRKYSLEFYYQKVKSRIFRFLIDFRLSKYSKPIRYAIKYYRRKKWSKQLVVKGTPDLSFSK